MWRTHFSACACAGECSFVERNKAVSLIAVIVVFVIAAQGRETPQADAVREKDLGTCVHPHLGRQRRKQKRMGGLERHLLLVGEGAASSRRTI